MVDGMVPDEARHLAPEAELRPLVASDNFLLRAATLLNLNWKDERLDYAQMDADPHLSCYYRVDLDGGDYGIVALAGVAPVGVAWLRYFSADQPGYGFVRPDVPELGLCVLPGYREKGLGTRLLDAILHEARHRSLAEISLSVEEGNPARRLYERFGFSPVERAMHGGTMSVLTAAARAGDSSRQRAGRRSTPPRIGTLLNLTIATGNRLHDSGPGPEA